ncbi:MAG: hypothetical protein QG648_361 [Patescibacteria group bacterium]|nr:hypothetical protein [Patescibacteria group bacterium]
MKKYFWLAGILIIIIVGLVIWNASQKSVSLPVTKVTTTTTVTSTSKTLLNKVKYTCDAQKTIEATFYEGTEYPVNPGEMPIPSGSVKLVLSDGRTLNLPQTISADGVRYADANESFVFWSKGDEALVLENGEEKEYKNCVVSDSLTSFIQAFGQQLKKVSLTSPVEQLKQEIKENYQDFLAPDLLAEWLAEPSQSLGRLTSSPWPDRIEIKSIITLEENKYLVKGDLIEVTSVEVVSGGKASSRPIELTVENSNGKWFISEIKLGSYQ